MHYFGLFYFSLEPRPQEALRPKKPMWHLLPLHLTPFLCFTPLLFLPPLRLSGATKTEQIVAELNKLN